MKLLMGFFSVWDGSLGRFITVEHHIYQKPDFSRAVQHLYRAGMNKGEHEGQETDWLLNEEALELPMSKQASPVAFAPKKDGKSISVLTAKA